MLTRRGHASRDEVVVVTGSSGGVGRAVAHAFARRGARVGLVARGRKGLEDAREEVEALGGRALVVPTDVADPDQVEAAAAAVETELGPIDVWVNDAMSTIFAPFVEIRPEEFRRATEVTYLGTVYGTMAALKRMVPRDRGTVVQVGSALAYRAIPLQSAYCGAKFGIRGFTGSVRTELMHRKSRVWITMVQLPAVNTPQFNWCLSRLPRHPQPVPPIYQPEVPAEAVYYAAHHRRREVICGGMALAVVLGSTFFPGLADRYMARTGVRSQQVEDMPSPPDRPSNLFQPVEELAATHGIFDRRSHERSYQTWATTHRPAVAVAGVLAGLGLGLVQLARRPRRRAAPWEMWRP
ncbi:MAG TPA: SDR family oxidoreductase [Candidatus Dormibacteraeota bacterium]|nr:SDR family oxidoreductase [Candidatus Dormibacteraeota bacterium]